MNIAGSLAIVLVVTGILTVMGSSGHSDTLHDERPTASIVMKERLLLGFGAGAITLGGTLLLLVGLGHMRRESRLRYY